jgi:hypothetical protein
MSLELLSLFCQHQTTDTIHLSNGGDTEPYERQFKY